MLSRLTAMRSLQPSVATQAMEADALPHQRSKGRVKRNMAPPPAWFSAQIFPP